MATLRPYLLLLLLTACDGSKPTEPRRCPAPSPAFTLLVRTHDASALPAKTEVKVTFGGNNVETYVVGKQAAGAKAVFCTTSGGAGGAAGAGGAQGDDDEGEGGAGGAGASEISCELWTDGAAKLEVVSEGYLTLTRELEAKRDECGIVTTKVEVVLGADEKPDGGA